MSEVKTFESVESELERLATVPEDIRVFVRALFDRVKIGGICDPFYVANVAAVAWGRGDGCGKFGSYPIDRNSKPREVLTARLASAYSTCFQESGFDDKQARELLNALQDVFSKATERLACNCCGSSTSGRQWWNRDTGYGVCVECSRDREYKTPSMAGYRGVHFDLTHFA